MAAVTRPESGSQTWLTRQTAPGISNFWSRNFSPWLVSSRRVAPVMSRSWKKENEHFDFPFLVASNSYKFYFIYWPNPASFCLFFQFQTKFLLNYILGIEWAKKFDQTRAQWNRKFGDFVRARFFEFEKASFQLNKIIIYKLCELCKHKTLNFLKPGR